MDGGKGQDKDMKASVTGISDIGIKRKSNQDSYLLKSIDTDSGDLVLLCVCDGLGGLSRGELASAEVIRAMSVWFDSWCLENQQNMDLDDVGRQWAELLQNKSRSIITYSRALEEQMGTTFSGILITSDGRYLIGHIGDTRVYRINEVGVSVLTMDHTVTQVALQRGTMTPEQAKKDPRKHVLTQCIGTNANPDIDFLTGEVRSGEMYLVCSDGFRNKLTDAEIAGCNSAEFYFDEAKINSHLCNLVELIKTREETDNMTAVLACIDSGAGDDTGTERLDSTEKLSLQVKVDKTGIHTEEVIHGEGEETLS